MRRFQSIQVLRAVAACAVLVLHAYPRPHEPVGDAGYGAFGVDLFFVISGFIMAQVARDRSASQFVYDRLWRIYPLWWIAVLPWLFLVPRGPVFAVSSLTLWPIYAGGYYVPVLKVGWTLSFELIFYAGMAVALASRAIVPLAIYGLLLIGSLTVASPLFHFVGNPMVFEFLLGVTVAKLPRRAALAWLIPISIVAVALTSPATGDVEATIACRVALQRAIEWGLPAALIVWGALSIESIFEKPVFRVPVALGNASYSIYLFHPLIAYGLDAPWPVRLAAAIALGCTMHWLVERRIIKSKARIADAMQRLIPKRGAKAAARQEVTS